ncbi:VOC family protein [Marinomonas balearica]|uniref:Catechol 2,3-dioxygenase-like lactoylglutathione lyase family enzyme n=1 Tax=Marinomonas balearica TaxID=491947 RepID=A0A4R6MHE7_9GAMM|nr:VOC family protein [Marinomonas balearica]TDO99589.1 catechol 2,3-dioxygenase-like lactoylglutathione lyase family enzyme [Marinomonas balearica]
MKTEGEVNFPNMGLSHVELYVQDIAKMVSFYTENLGFVVTDKGEGSAGMVFLSRNPEEHHQIVLNPRESHRTVESPIDHISFRVASTVELKTFYKALSRSPDIKLDTVSHGTAWSIYFRDPENNRFEIFTDTPWHVNQPCKFAVDFSLSDEALIAFTENKIKDLPEFSIVGEWKKAHSESLES